MKKIYANDLPRPLSAAGARLAEGRFESLEEKACCEFYSLIKHIADSYSNWSRDFADELEGHGMEEFILFFRSGENTKLYEENPKEFNRTAFRHIWQKIRSLKESLIKVSASANRSADKDKTPASKLRKPVISYYGSLEPLSTEFGEEDAFVEDCCFSRELEDEQSRSDLECFELRLCIADILTEKQRKVFELLANGWNHREIAGKFGVSVQAVDKTVKQIRMKGRAVICGTKNL